MIEIAWVQHSTLTELALLSLAFVLSAAIGMERGRRLKSAGLRTHVLVGIGSALFTLVSGYGFSSLLSEDVVLDPSRIAAQIVSGIGFMGAGVIFVRNSTVNGLTTAASIWMTAAIGMACGAGMPLLAAAATAMHLLTVTGLNRVTQRIRRASTHPDLVIEYKQDRGAMREVLLAATGLGFSASLAQWREVASRQTPRVRATLRFQGNTANFDELVAAVAAVRGVTKVQRVSGTDDD